MIRFPPHLLAGAADPTSKRKKKREIQLYIWKLLPSKFRRWILARETEFYRCNADSWEYGYYIEFKRKIPGGIAAITITNIGQGPEYPVTYNVSVTINGSEKYKNTESFQNAVEYWEYSIK